MKRCELSEVSWLVKSRLQELNSASVAKLWNRTAPTQLHAASFYHWWVSRCKVQLIRHDVETTFWIEAKLLMSPQSIQFPFTKSRQDIGALPGVSRWGTTSVVDFLKQPVADGLSSVLLFGVPDKVWRQIPGYILCVLSWESCSWHGNTFFQVEKREDGIAGEREENPVMEAVRSQFLVWFKKSGGIEWAENREWPKGTSEIKERRGRRVYTFIKRIFWEAEAEMEEEYDLTHMM